MTAFKIHTADNAPEKSREILKSLQAKLGFVPNVLGEIAESPALLKGWWELSAAAQMGKFTPVEIQIVQIEASRLSDCGYCVAAGTTLGEKTGVPREVLNALREDKPLADAKLESLRQFTRTVMKKMGRAEPRDIDAFIKAGYSHEHVMEVVLHMASKLITNTVNHMAATPLDKPFEPNRFEERHPRKDASRSAA